LALREQYKEEILRAANQSVIDGSPINTPLWWTDPTDPETFTIDSGKTCFLKTSDKDCGL